MEGQPLVICILVFLCYQDNAGIWDEVTNVSSQPQVGCGLALGYHKWRGCRWRFLQSIGDIWYSTTQGGGPRPIFHAARAYEQAKIQVLPFAQIWDNCSVHYIFCHLMCGTTCQAGSWPRILESLTCSFGRGGLGETYVRTDVLDALPFLWK